MHQQHKADHASGYVFVRSGKRGDRWYAHYRANGARHKKLLGPAWTGKGRPPAGYCTKRLAEAALQAILTDARRGELPIASPVKTVHTFKDAYEEYLRYLEVEKGRSLGTLRGYRSTIRNYLSPTFPDDTLLDSITTEQVDALTSRLLAEGKLSRRTVQKARVMLGSILKRAKRKQWIATNVADDAERINLQRSGNFTFLEPEEVMAVARHADDEQDAALFTVAAFTGLRMGELRALRWRDIDFAGSGVVVRRNKPAHEKEKDPKSGKVRSVPLIDQAAAALDKLSRRSHFTAAGDFVFVSAKGGYIDDGDARTAFYAALKRAGLGHLRQQEEPITFHDLRHTFATLGARAGWQLTDLQAYMGHADIQTTMIYAHFMPKHNAAAELTAMVAKALGATDSGASLVPSPNGHPVPASKKSSVQAA